MVMDDATTALVVLAGVVGLFVWNRLPVGAVAILAALTLWATGLVSTDEAVAGFGDPVVIFIATLFVVSEAIDSTGVTTWAGRWLLDHAGTGATRVLVAVCLLSALLTSLITLNGAVAALLPLVVLIAHRLGLSPSQLLMPVAFAGSAGGMLMLMSSPVNVITPLMVYLPFIILVCQRYRASAGMGTVISLMIPYTVVVLVSWTLLFVGWYLLEIPWGPGSPVQLD
jgi:p-aminobenzoyl-glutamate transporter AbgT